MTPEEFQEYTEWLNDPKAQAEYHQWRIKDDLKRSQLPDPLTTDIDVFMKSFNEIFGVRNEPRC